MRKKKSSMSRRPRLDAIFSHQNIRATSITRPRGFSLPPPMLDLFRRRRRFSETFPLPPSRIVARGRGNHLIMSRRCHSDGGVPTNTVYAESAAGKSARARARARAIHALNTGARRLAVRVAGEAAAARPLAGRLRRTCFLTLARASRHRPQVVAGCFIFKR